MPWMRTANKKWLAEHGTYTGEPNSIGWRCKTTNALMLAERTGRSIWADNGPGPCAGSGEVRQVIEAYCPKCDSKPQINHGSPIQEGELIAI